jgi:aryl-alcohol dehydrogenase-like predicted oxidoreductase
MAVEAAWIAKTERLTPFVSAQNEYNMLNRKIEEELLPVSERYGLGQLPYFPLASGFLTGKYRRGEAPPDGTRLAAWAPLAKGVLTDENFDKLDGWEKFASEREHSMLDLAMSWLGSNPGVSSVIAGATSPEQVEANVSAVDWKLTPEERAAL